MDIDTSSDFAMRSDLKIFSSIKPRVVWDLPADTKPIPRDPIPPNSSRIARRILPRAAVALGGLAGNNAHGAGFLEALRRNGILPQMISCTSGQLRCVEVFLKGGDIQEWFEQELAQMQPFTKNFPHNIDANLLFKMTMGQMQRIRPSVREFPFDLITTLQRNWWNFWRNPWDFSFFQETWDVWPARSLVCREPSTTYEEIADTFNDQKDVGIIFNAYEYLKGIEVVYMNDRAFELTGKRVGPHPYRRVRYERIDSSAVRNALRLYEYGFADRSEMIDGAYIRDIILSEIPDETNNSIDRIAVARPQASKWLGPAPLSWTELRDMQTEINFNGTYFGECDRIFWMNERGKRPIKILELPLDCQRGWWDYVLEDIDVFRSAYWRGLELAESELTEREPAESKLAGRAPSYYIQYTG